MKKRLAVCAAAALAASLTLGSLSTAYAATEMTLAGFGAEVKKEEAQPKETEAKKAETEPKETEVKKAETEPKETEVKKAETEQKETEAKKAETEAATEAVTEAPVDRSMVDTTGFAKAEDYINVRAAGYAEADVVGTLRNNDAVYIEEVDADGWYKIRSGNVEGYVAGYLIATGDEAASVAQSAAYTYAQVGAESLNVRADASEDAEVVDMVGPTSDLEVVEDLGNWVKVVTENGVYGYVSADYVSTETVYPTGETVQEQSEREEAEYLAAVAQQEAEAQAAAAAAAQAQAEAEAALLASMSPEVLALYQAYLAAQEAAMHPVDEADAAAKAQAAIDAYNAYIAACNGKTPAPQPAPTTDTTQSSVEEDTTADDEEYVDATDDDEEVVEAAEDDEEYVEAAEDDEEDSGTEDLYVDEASENEEDTSTTSVDSNSRGAQIAAYATQFVGNPYVYGGASLTGGADCSGFTMAVFANFGIGLPHNAAAQSGCGRSVSLSDLQPGDLLFYDNGGGIGHVTLYIGGGQVVHASSPETGIKISAYNYRTPVCAVRCW